MIDKKMRCKPAPHFKTKVAKLGSAAGTATATAAGFFFLLFHAALFRFDFLTEAFHLAQGLLFLAQITLQQLHGFLVAHLTRHADQAFVRAYFVAFSLDGRAHVEGIYHIGRRIFFHKGMDFFYQALHALTLSLFFLSFNALDGLAQPFRVAFRLFAVLRERLLQLLTVGIV